MVGFACARFELNRTAVGSVGERISSASLTSCILLHPSSMPRYNHATIEPKWQAYWEQHQTFAAPRLPKPGTQEALRARYVPVPQRRRAARRASRRVHGDRHRLPRRADAGPERDAPDGLRRVRPAGRGARDQDGRAPADSDRKEHRQLPPAAEAARLLLRLGPRAGHDRRRILPLDAVDLPADLRHVVRSRAAARPADQRAADSGRRASRRATMRFARIRTSTAWPIKPKRR